jgi:ATP-dependent Clp protease ATP-binding subunit ClpC
MKMEEILGKRLVGHESNIARIANVIRRNHAGFGAQRPIGSFLFLGPTGVGKTEAAKVLADYLFGSPKNIVRFDMSEFMEQHSVAKLIGAPAGYVGFDDGGLLTEALRKRPYQIVLFDEIEKAHPDVMNILLQILDEGRLTDAKGRHVDFSNTVIIMTSNLGAAEVMQAAQTSIGFAGKPLQLTPEETESIILKSATARFTPELWNRIEEKLVFHPLTLDQIERIAHLLLADSAKRLLADKRIVLSFEESTLIPYLIQNGGFEPSYGARPMRKTIQSLVESKIAEWILEHDDLPKELFVNLQNDVVHVEEIKPL